MLSKTARGTPGLAGLFSPECNFGAGGQSRQIVELVGPAGVSEPVTGDEAAEWAAMCAASGPIDRLVIFSTARNAAGRARLASSNAEIVLVSGPWTAEAPDPTGSDQVVVADLADAGDMDRLRTTLEVEAPATLYIVEGVIERLPDPRSLLRALRALLRQHLHSSLVIVTPDRGASGSTDQDGTPLDPSCVRLWTLEEFDLALQAAGFAIESINWRPPSQTGTPKAIIEARLKCTEHLLECFFSSRGLPPSADHLVLTTEHARAERTGGIGTYHQLVSEVTGFKRLVLFSGMHGLPKDWQKYTLDQGWLHVVHLLGDKTEIEKNPWENNHESILKAVVQAIFLYDSIRLVEFQDYLGIGVHVAQAKRAGLLPPSVTVMTYSHGSHFYLDHAAGEVSSTRDVRMDACERLCLELSDVVVFASKFLRDLYIDQQGLQLRAVEMQGYPIMVSRSGVDRLERSAVKTLVFYGKQTPQKGYPDFCEAVLELFAKPDYSAAAGQIKRIALMGVDVPEKRILELTGVEIVYGTWSRERAFQMLQEFGDDSIVVLPYRGDNHPLSISEVVQADCQILAYRAGGLPEILPASLHDRVLCNAGAANLAAALAREIMAPVPERIALIGKTRQLIADFYDQVTVSYKAMIERLKSVPTSPGAECRAVTVIVPNYNGPADYIKDVAFGVRNSTRRPEEVIVVDDCSTEENFRIVEQCLEAFGPVPARIVRNPNNLGLAGTRNTGLKHVRTPYVCAHDNDNILGNLFLETACRILDANPEVAAITTWLTGFTDSDNWKIYDSKQYRYRPLGPDLGIGLRSNEFGDALAVYRVEALKRIGGWDGSSKALWEDWQLFVRLTMLGEKILIIPRELFLYRIRPGSMARTYSKFFGHMRLARAISGMPLAEANAVLRAIMSPPAETQRELEHLRWRCDQLQSELGNARSEAERQSRRVMAALESSKKERDTLRRTIEMEREQRRAGPEVASSEGQNTNYLAGLAIPASVFGARPKARKTGLFRWLTGRTAPIGITQFSQPDPKKLTPEQLMLFNSRFFDVEWYLRQYAVEMIGKKNPYKHFLQYGATGDFDPGPFFNSRRYLEMYIDVADAGQNPLLHYIRFGVAEGRRIEKSYRDR